MAGGYNYTKGNAVSGNIGNQKFNQYSLKLDYALSVRTDLYMEGTFQQASGNQLSRHGRRGGYRPARRFVQQPSGRHARGDSASVLGGLPVVSSSSVVYSKSIDLKFMP